MLLTVLTTAIAIYALIAVATFVLALMAMFLLTKPTQPVRPRNKTGAQFLYELVRNSLMWGPLVATGIYYWLTTEPS